MKKSKNIDEKTNEGEKLDISFNDDCEDNLEANDKEDICDNLNEDNLSKEKNIIVHIEGEVKNPGIVTLDPNSRLVDAVNKCGGLTEKANKLYINLAKKVSDEEKIYIPSINEDIEELKKIDIYDSTNSISNDEYEDPDIQLVNINLADKDKLKTLPGIGDKTAEKIIEYRISNFFQTKKDIMNVPGIGQKTYENIESLITVE